jgi:hypothetical protein
MACLLTGFISAAEPAAPAKYIWTQHVTLAGDKAPNYPNLVGQWRHAAETTKSEVFWIAASNLTGDVRQVNFVSFYDTFAAVEKDMTAYKSIEAEVAQKNPHFAGEAGAAELEPRSTIAKYIPELSYQPEKVRAPDAQWWEVTTIHLKPGHMTAFADLVKQELDLLKKGNIDEHFLMYQLVAGLPTYGAAYYIVVPMKSLAEMDVDKSAQGKDIFTPMIRQHFEQAMEEIVSRVETNLLMVRPDMSRPPETFVSANPKFWTIQEPTAPVVAKGKKSPKKATAAVGE